MKKEIHPTTYRPVLFKDTSNNTGVIISSTIETEKEEKWTDGTVYPLYEVEVSSTSHPFYTGDQRILDTAGRAEKFRRRAAKAQAPKPKKKTLKEVAAEKETETATAEA